MPSETTNAFLTKQLFAEKNIVTYRSLSRELGIHVNDAKNDLATYYAQCTQSPAPCATYLIVGEENPAPSHHEESAMEVDNEGPESEHMDEDLAEGSQGGEDVPQTIIVLVSEGELADAQSKFRRVDAIHVYSLSPSPIQDATLLIAPTESVRHADNSKDGMEVAAITGKVVSKQVQLKAGGKVAPPVASSSNVKANVSSQPPLNGKEKGKEPLKPKEKPKATGKLDFGKAKTKATKKDEAKEKIIEPKQEITEESTTSVKSERVAEKKKSSKELKRGTKRKSVGAMFTDTDDSVSDVVKNESGVWIKRGAILSEDEDIPKPPRRRKKDSPVFTSESESEQHRSLRAMMDIDDDQVSHASRSRPTSSKSDDDEDVEMTDDTDPLPKPKRRRQEKKVVPVGRNGLPKKRVIKSRKKLDPQGYKVTEDYSSYESADEETVVKEEVPKKSKKKSAVGNDDKPSAALPSKKKSEANKRKGTGSSKSASSFSKLGSGGSIANFFGPAKNK